MLHTINCVVVRSCNFRSASIAQYIGYDNVNAPTPRRSKIIEGTIGSKIGSSHETHQPHSRIRLYNGWLDPTILVWQGRKLKKNLAQILEHSQIYTKYPQFWDIISKSYQNLLWVLFVRDHSLHVSIPFDL